MKLFSRLVRNSAKIRELTEAPGLFQDQNRKSRNYLGIVF